MDYVAITLIFRGITILIATCGAILSIYLGWKLYREGINSKVESEIAKGDQWKVTLKALGPGVFFAAFGMWILVKIIDNQTVVDPNGPEAPVTESASLQTGFLFGTARAAAPKKTAKTCFRYPVIRMSSGRSIEPAEFQLAIRGAVDLLRRGSFEANDRSRLISTVEVLSHLEAAEVSK